MLKGVCLQITLILILLGAVAMAQSAQPTYGAMNQTFMVQSGNERGTTFAIEVDNREYWITAKHLLTGAKHPPYGLFTAPSAVVSILNPGSAGQQWITAAFAVIDPGRNLDIVVLVPPHALLQNLQPLNLSAGEETIGGDCTFLGFPFGGGWRAHFESGVSRWYPYVKHCTVSAKLTDGPTVWVLDGINNAGFSGGPVLTGNGAQQKVFAVISGYRTEPSDVIPASGPIPSPKGAKGNMPARSQGEQGREVVNVNSGFILAFDIQPAIDAIRRHPVGPLHTPR